ncbi:gibberellin-regulated protein 11-like, partial [Salvia hispanica]|uniref:gibberellin-regulated protein 11-like n=1 Tax=Salvia hispanica TaxID=49212 RepID=UPI0020090D03
KNLPISSYFIHSSNNFDELICRYLRISKVEETTLVAKGNNRRLLGFVDCGQECKRRCSLHSRPNVCNRACGTCCQRCKCVPPGTHGNREVCGSCYTDMTTHGNRTKCLNFPLPSFIF